jgi:CRISPR-associated protein Cas4
MLIERLDTYAEKELSRPKRPKEKHWPSDAGVCIRALVYRWRGVEGIKRQARTFFIFEDGNLHHRSIRELLRQAGVEFVMEETPINDPKMRLSGKLDAVVRLDGKYYVLEIKSVNRFTFDEIMHQGPREEHALQLNLYLYYVQNLFRISTNTGILLYKCKDTSRFWEFPIPFDEKVVNNFFVLMHSVDDYLAKNIIPDRPYKITDWQCQYCDYRQVCWEGYATEEKNKFAEIKEEDLVNFIGELLWIREQIKELSEKEENLNMKIKEIMLAKNIESGRISNYFVELKEQTRQVLNQELLKEKIGNLEPFYKSSTYKVLKIKEL